MRISGFCLLISVVFLSIAVHATYATGGPQSPRTASMFTLLAVAILCLGALELKIHRRSRFRQQRNASTLASALRNGALR
jgi:hypothetical protein